MIRPFIFIIFFCFGINLFAQSTKDSIAYMVGLQMENSFYEGNADFVSSIFNNEKFRDLFLLKDDNNPDLKAFHLGFSQQNWAEAYARPILYNLEQGGYYNFVNYYKDAYDNYFLIFRFFGNEGINYHEYLLQIENKDQYYIIDIFNYLSGEFLSQTAEQIYLPLAMEYSKFQPDESFLQNEVEDLIKLSKVKQLIQEGKLKKAKTLFFTINEDLRATTAFTAIEFQLTSLEDEADYKEILERMMKNTESPACVHLMSIDYYFMNEQYDQCMAAIDSLYSYTKDDFLDFYRGNIAFAEGNVEKSRAFFQRMAYNFPYTPEGYDYTLAMEYQLMWYDSMLVTLDTLANKMDFYYKDLDPIMQSDYPLFTEKKLYKDWLKDRLESDQLLEEEFKETSKLIELSPFQQELNEKYANPDLSPLKEEDLATFKQLDFYPYDASYKVEARLERTQSSEVFKMKTTTDRLPDYRQYGILHFRLEGKDFQLPIYQNVSMLRLKEYRNLLFFPFTDDTNGETSYGGGRYIDVRIPEGDTIILDFNEAYNPYCAYNDKYSCPIPPSENYIPIEIKAGVKKFKD